MAEILGLIGSIASVIITGCFSVYLLKLDKKQTAKNDEFSELHKENLKLLAEIQENEHSERTRLDNQIQMDISALSKEVKALRKELDTQKISADLQQLKVLNQFHFDYIRSLSGVVVTLGDTIAATSPKSTREDRDAIAKMQLTIENHKDKETKILSSLFKVII